MTLYEYLVSVLSEHNKKISDISFFGGLECDINFNYLDFAKTTDYFGRTDHDCCYNDDSDLIGLNLWVKRGNIINLVCVGIKSNQKSSAKDNIIYGWHFI